MTSDSGIVVKSNRFPEVKSRMTLGGKTVVREILNKIADDIEATGPYKGELTAKAKVIGGIGTVEVNPWWIGFIEFGSVTHAARPFAGPAANRVFATLTPKLKALGDAL